MGGGVAWLGIFKFMDDGGCMKAEDFISQEISSYEVQLNDLEILKKKVKESVDELASSYCGIINAKENFEFVKKQNIEELRLYKFAIKAECDEIEKRMKQITDLSKNCFPCSEDRGRL